MVVNPCVAIVLGGGIAGITLGSLFLTGKLEHVIDDIVVNLSELALIIALVIPAISIIISCCWSGGIDDILHDVKETPRKVEKRLKGSLLEAIHTLEQVLRDEIKEAPKEVIHHLEEIKDKLFGAEKHGKEFLMKEEHKVEHVGEELKAGCGCMRR